MPKNRSLDAEQAELSALSAETEPGFRFYASDKYGGAIGGTGKVFGTDAYQSIRVWDVPGSIVFDGSFNQGGDNFFLGGAAGDWKIARSGSSVQISKADTVVTIPVGEVGSWLFFDNRALLLGIENDAIRIGDQDVSAVPTTISAATQEGYSDPPPADSFGRLFLESGGETVIYDRDGHTSVFGTDESEQLTVVGGSISLDASFNRGGDTLTITEAPSRDEVSLVRSGSSVILRGDGLEVVIPVGSAGMTVELGEAAYDLAYEPVQDAIVFGDQTIGTVPVTIAFG